ncbi:UNVERIFIED_CONTAM: hypothetical protein Scaly_0468500 [Sesamum calycinum]|uniref:UspA domain-containing protein n=1 Tax=Sesamum calycinum TaxID=2727403 RepID=A0AAW2SG53_9LAMI
MEKSVMVVGLDDSDHSFYALEWTLQHFFSPSPENSPFKLVIVHAKPSALTAIGLAGPGSLLSVPLCGFGFEEDCCQGFGKGQGIVYS